MLSCDAYEKSVIISGLASNWLPCDTVHTKSVSCEFKLMLYFYTSQVHPSVLHFLTCPSSI